MLIHPQIDPVAFSIGPLAVRWYGLMYLAGFGAAWWLGQRRIKGGLAAITRQQFDDLIFLAVLGVILLRRGRGCQPRSGLRGTRWQPRAARCRRDRTRIAPRPDG